MRKALLFAFSLAGLFVSLYLLWTYTAPGRPMACLGTGCDIVRASAYARIGGLPTPLYGVVMYAVLALLAFGPTLAPRAGRFTEWSIASVSGAGFLASLYLSGIEQFVLLAWCAWCVASAVSVTLIFALALLDVFRPAPCETPRRVPSPANIQLVVFVAALAAGAPAFYALTKKSEVPPSAPIGSEEILKERLVRPESHSTGNLQARLTVVEFGDFQCPYCSEEEKTAREIRQRYAGDVRFVFRQFPLVHMHAYAEKAAEASECAAEQGKFWEAVEKFYDNQSDLSEAALGRYAAELGLDTGRFNTCLSSGAKAWQVQRDIEDGKAAGVTRTPTFFIGHERFEGALEYDQFAEIINRDLGATNASNGPGPLLNDPGTGFFHQAASSNAGCSEDEAKKLQPQVIHTDEARKLRGSARQALFIDVRPAADFSTHISGAMNVPADEFGRKLADLPRDRTLILYESGQSPAASADVCAASRSAGRILLEHGFSYDRVKVYQEGLAGWKSSGLPLESGSPRGR